MKNAENELTERVENPKAKYELKHRTAKDRNLNSHKASYKANDSGEKAGHVATPLKRKPIFKQLVKAKRQKIGKESNYNNSQITENGLKQSKPRQSAQPLFDNHFKDTKPNEDTKNGKNKGERSENRENSS